MCCCNRYSACCNNSNSLFKEALALAVFGTVVQGRLMLLTLWLIIFGGVVTCVWRLSSFSITAYHDDVSDSGVDTFHTAVNIGTHTSSGSGDGCDHGINQMEQRESDRPFLHRDLLENNLAFILLGFFVSLGVFTLQELSNSTSLGSAVLKESFHFQPGPYTWWVFFGVFCLLVLASALAFISLPFGKLRDEVIARIKTWWIIVVLFW